MMSELVNQIQLFHALKLNPISRKMKKIWEHEIERNLIITNNIKECYVFINTNDMKARINENHSYARMTLRPRKKKNCCLMCM